MTRLTLAAPAQLSFRRIPKKRHQELLVSVLGKIGDIFAAKK